MKLRIGGLVDISTVDYRGHVTFMIFFAGCNFRCPFCQNAPLIPVGSGREVDLDYVRRRVEESAPLLDAVGASGGEPALQPGALTELFRWAKGRGLRTFLNTNASCPAVVGRLVEEGLVDHVAMDVKGPLSDPERLGAIIGLPEKEASRMAENIRRTLRICLENGVPLEVRTTVVPSLVDDEETIRAICRAVSETGGCDAYCLQQFVPMDSVLDPRLREVDSPSRDLLASLARAALEEGMENVYVRTREHGVERIG